MTSIPVNDWNTSSAPRVHLLCHLKGISSVLVELALQHESTCSKQKELGTLTEEKKRQSPNKPKKARASSKTQHALLL